MQSTQQKLEDTGCDDLEKPMKQSSFKVKNWEIFNLNNSQGNNSLIE